MRRATMAAGTHVPITTIHERVATAMATPAATISAVSVPGSGDRVTLGCRVGAAVNS